MNSESTEAVGFGEAAPASAVAGYCRSGDTVVHPAAGSVPLSAIRVGTATGHTPLPRLFLRPTFGEQLLSAQWRELFGGLCGFCWRFGGDVLPAGHSRNLRCCGFFSGGRPVFNNGVFPVYAHFCGVTVGVTGFP